MRWRAIALLGGATLCGGCSLVVSLDDLGGAADGTSSDAGDDSGGNLVTNPSFDTGAGGCGPSWGNGYSESFTRASPGRTGSSSCEVCEQAAGDSYELDDTTAIPVQAGSYYAEAWLSTPDGGVATQVGLQIYFTGNGTVTNCNGNDTDYCQANFFSPPGGSWSSSSTTFDVTGSGTVRVDIHSYAAPGGSCFLVDDVALYAQ